MIHNKWIIMSPTLCQGDIPAWFDDNERPVLYESKVEAYKEIADSMIQELQQFVDGERELEDTDFAAEDYVISCEYDDETGMIYSEDGQIIYNPKTFVR